MPRVGANPLKCCSEYWLQFWTGRTSLDSVPPRPQCGLGEHARLSLLTSPTLWAAMRQPEGHSSPRLRPLVTAAWHHSSWPHSARSTLWGSLGAAAGGSGRLVWVIFCLGFFVSSSSSVSLSQTWTTTLGVDSVPAWSSYFSPGEVNSKKKKKRCFVSWNFLFYSYCNCWLLVFKSLNPLSEYSVLFWH